MSGSQTNEVDTYGPLGCFAVRRAHPCTARQLKAAVGEKLDLQLSSLPLFGLFEGPLGAPCRCSVVDQDTCRLSTNRCVFLCLHAGCSRMTAQWHQRQRSASSDGMWS